ncbi:exo-alpha-sialidase [Trypanosoma cruzi]|nr:exo-alpha-sialidase [Trypanosoma cruzi]
MRAVGCDCCGGPHLLVCASPPLCRAFAHVICYARACWACFSGALGGHHLSMAVCVSGHVRMRVGAYGMKEWLGERGIQFGGYLDQIHLAAVDTCTTDVFPHNGRGCDRIVRSGPSMQFGFYSTGAQWSSCNGW